eukprot:gene2234-2546_t
MPQEQNSTDECWICLNSENGPERSLEQPCNEERFCRFCKQEYAFQWHQTLSSQLPAAAPTPTMAIMFEGKVHRIKVFPGPEGKKRFEQEVRRLINLGDDEEFDIEFQCKSPLGGNTLKLGGLGAFDAATHCAALTAAERQHKRQQQGQAQPQPASGDKDGSA